MINYSMQQRHRVDMPQTSKLSHYSQIIDKNDAYLESDAEPSDTASSPFRSPLNGHIYTPSLFPHTRELSNTDNYKQPNYPLSQIQQLNDLSHHAATRSMTSDHSFKHTRQGQYKTVKENNKDEDVTKTMLLFNNSINEKKKNGFVDSHPCHFYQPSHEFNTRELNTYLQSKKQTDVRSLSQQSQHDNNKSPNNNENDWFPDVALNKMDNPSTDLAKSYCHQTQHNTLPHDHFSLFKKQQSSPYVHHLQTETSHNCNPGSFLETIYYSGIPESVLLKDIVYPLQGINGTFIKYHEPSQSFLIRQDINVSRSVRLLTSRVCTIGIYYRRLRSYLDPSVQLSMSLNPQETIQKWWDYHSTDPSPIKALQSSDHCNEQNIASDLSAAQSNSLTFLSDHTITNKDPTHSTSLQSILHESFSQFLRDQLTTYYKLLAVIENEIVCSTNSRYPKEVKTHASPTCSTLRHLTLWLQDPLQRMSLLALLTEAVRHLKGGPFLSVVFDHSQRGDTAGKKLLGQMFKHIIVPWSEIIYQWIIDGSIVDPYNEFFVTKQHTISSETSYFKDTTHYASKINDHNYNHSMYKKQLTSFTMQEYHDETILPEILWSSVYQITASRVPIFLKRDIAQRILTCGKAVAMIQLFQCLESKKLKSSALIFGSSHTNTRYNRPRHSSEGKESICGVRDKDINLHTTQQISHQSTHTFIPNHLHSYPQEQDNLTDHTIIQCHGVPSKQFESIESDVVPKASWLSSSKKTQLQRRIKDDTYHKALSLKPQQKYVEHIYNLTSCSGKRSDFLFDVFEPRCHFENDKINLLNKVNRERGFKDFEEMASVVSQLEQLNCKQVIDLLFYRYHFLCHIEGIRRFLLLGQGDFVAELLSQFSPYSSHYTKPALSDYPGSSLHYTPLATKAGNGCDLSRYSDTILNHHLHACLQFAIGLSNAQYFPQELLDRLSIYKLTLPSHYNQENNHSVSSSDLIGWEVVSLDYVTDGSPISLVLNNLALRQYRIIHSLLWRIHRVSYGLSRVWLNHIRNCRQRTSGFSKRHISTYRSILPGITILEDLTEDLQWAVERCESLYIEMTHFLRNLQSFFMYEVIEPSWLTFIQQMDSLVNYTKQLSEHDSIYRTRTSTVFNFPNKQHNETSSSSLIDTVIACHTRYITSMLNGLFLTEIDDHHLMNTHTNKNMIRHPLLTSISELDHHIIALRLLKDNTMTTQQDNIFIKNTTTLGLILQMTHYIVQFISLADILFTRLYCSSHDQQEELINRLDVLGEDYSQSLIQLLKHLNTISRASKSYQSSNGPSTRSSSFFNEEYEGVNHHDAIRALLYRLDFNNFYGSDWELYKTRSTLSTQHRRYQTHHNLVPKQQVQHHSIPSVISRHEIMGQYRPFEHNATEELSSSDPDTTSSDEDWSSDVTSDDTESLDDKNDH